MNINLRLVLCTIIFCCCQSLSFSQNLLDNVKYETEVGAYISTSGQTPFWQRANQYGIVPLQSPFISLRGSAHKDYDSTINSQLKLKKFGIGYGFGAVTNIGKKSGLFLPEAYLKVRYGIFEFYGGRRKEIIGLVDTTLTSGSYIWSGNALPMPKIQILIPNYASILGHGLIAIKGGFAHGWFGNQTYTQNYYLHQKWLYGRVGKPNWKVNFYSGFNHQVQWGGYAPLLINSPNAAQDGYLASDFNTFMNIAFPFSFIRKAFQPKTKIKNDSDNYGGNQLGSVDFAGEIKLKKLNIFVYRQIPYELGSLFSSLVNADDGLYGISVKLKKPFYTIHKFTIEGFHSFNQGTYRSGIARLLNLPDKHSGEYHNYLNHGQYRDGWSYKNNGIGTPLILNNKEILPSLQQDFLFSNYNRVKSVIGSFEGKVSKLNYGVKTSYAIYSRTAKIRNQNNYYQFSTKIFAKFKIKKGDTFTISYALDNGQMLKNNNGFAFSFMKSWL